MKCVYCNSELVTSLDEYKASLDGKEIIVKDVNVIKCTRCGEEFIDSKTMKNLNKLILKN